MNAGRREEGRVPLGRRVPLCPTSATRLPRLKGLVGAMIFAVAGFATEPCAPCHAEQIADVAAHKHGAKGVTCAVCHGASEKHRNATGAVPPDRVAAPDEVPALCGTCHTEQKKDYLTSKHAKLVLERAKVKSANCATCHGVHAMQRAEARCARCHTALPATCTTGTSCSSCHAKHTMAAKK